MNVGQWLDDIGDSFSISIIRYPITFAIAFITCLYLSSNIGSQGHVNSDIVIGLLLSGLLTLLGYNLTELLSIDGIKKHGFGLLGAGLGFCFYWLITHVLMDNGQWKSIVVSIIIFNIIVLYLLLPFILRSENISLQRYLVHFLENFGESVALSIILYLVLLSAIYAVDKLLDVGIEKLDLYAHIGIWIAGFFMPLSFLANTLRLPLVAENLPTYSSRFFKILILYIGIPVGLVYGLIIIAYVVKFVITGQYKDWTLMLFTWFLALGILVHMMNKIFIRDNKNEIADLFDKYFPYMGIVLSICYVWICNHSVQNIGLTTSNYFAAMFSVISVLIFCMLSFWKAMDHRYIYLLIMVASLFAIVSGPYNCYDAPIKSQADRLLSFLKNNNRYDEKGYKIGDKAVDQIKLANITSGINQVDGTALDKIVRQYDKGKFFKDTMQLNAYEVFRQLGVNYGGIDNGMMAFSNKFNEFLAPIKFETGDEYLPTLNAYANVEKGYNGLMVATSGKLYIYANGQAIDSLSINTVIINNQPIKVRSFVKSQSYDIYIQNINYETSNDQILVREFNGMVIRKR